MGTSEHFRDFLQRRKRSLWAPNLIWSGLETVFGDLRAFSGFPEKAKTLSVGPKLIWSGLETIFGDLRAFSGFPEKGKTLSVGPKVDLEWSGDRFRGPQNIFGISLNRENALCGPQS